MWIWAIAANGAVPELPCATMALLPYAPPLARNVPRLGLVPGPVSHRDPYNVPNVDTSSHFAVRWGNGATVRTTEVDRLLLALETAWQTQVDTLGMRAPATTADYYFNVYIGDTGDNTPSAYGAGGYYWVDPNGVPMIVISRGALQDEGFSKHAAYHEFFHALQGETERFTYDGPAAWFWEATAEWAAIETDPTSTENGSFVFSYLLLPALPVNFFDYPDTGALQEYYQYGAFLFPHDLTQQLGADLVPDAWNDGGNLDDPLEVLRAKVAAKGSDLDVLWLDHLAHNAVYDYDAGDLYESFVEGVAPYFPAATRFAVDLTREGGEGRIGPQLAPYRYGSASISLRNPDDGSLLVTVDGDQRGREGSTATYGARVTVIARSGSFTYYDVPMDGRSGLLEIDDIGEAQEVVLSVGAIADYDPNRWTTEVFPFDYALVVLPPPTPTTPTIDTTPTEDAADNDRTPVASCGCDAGSPGTPLWLGLIPGLLIRRRAGK